MPRLLYRLEGHTALPLTPAWHAALLTHITHDGLTSILMQVGDRQQAYLAIDGCDGCVYHRCIPGCPRDLFARALAYHHPEVALHHVSGGLASRSYPRVALAVPLPDAQPLDAACLAGLDEARLVLQWRIVKGQLSVGALLATGDVDPAAQLQRFGWKTHSGLGSRRLLQAPIPSPLAIVRPWKREPYLVMPMAVAPEGPAPDGANAHDAESDSLAALLIAQIEPLLVVDPAADTTFFRQSFGEQAMTINDDELGADVAEVAVMEPPEVSIWPAGPGRMRPSQVGFLIEQIRTSPIVQTGLEIGVTRRRLAQLLPEDLAEYSRQLMVWLHQSGALVPPTVPDEPFRNPRALAVSDDATLAALLHATPPPDAETARTLMQQ